MCVEKVRGREEEVRWGVGVGVGGSPLWEGQEKERVLPGTSIMID